MIGGRGGGECVIGEDPHHRIPRREVVDIAGGVDDDPGGFHPKPLVVLLALTTSVAVAGRG